jgi:hypothetical protein
MIQYALQILFYYFYPTESVRHFKKIIIISQNCISATLLKNNNNITKLYQRDTFKNNNNIKKYCISATLKKNNITKLD